ELIWHLPGRGQSCLRLVARLLPALGWGAALTRCTCALCLDAACTEWAFTLDIKIPGHRGDVRGFAPELPGVSQDDLRSSAPELNAAVDLDVLAFELPHVSHVAQVTGEDDRSEGTFAVVCAKIQEP